MTTDQLQVTHLDHHFFHNFLKEFKNASLVNAQGELLFSKDESLQPTTTSRLVNFQIAKKYLSPKVGDIIISNDPENGGYEYDKIFFVSGLNEHLYVIWEDDCAAIDFKIPITPLLEKEKKNDFVWQALVVNHPHNNILAQFFEKQIHKAKNLLNSPSYLDMFSSEDYQKDWLWVCQNEFNHQFDLRAQGQKGLSLNYNGKLIKMNLSLDEKLNLRTISLDFSSTQIADQFCAASHVVESALIYEIAQEFKISHFLSQPLLNLIKLTLPPKSVISKAHPQGDFNFEIQQICRQMFKYLFDQINTTKKSDHKFQLKSEALIKIKNKDFPDQELFFLFLDDQLCLPDCHHSFIHNKNSSIENEFHIELTTRPDKNFSMNVKYIKSEFDHSKRWIKINNIISEKKKVAIKGNDLLTFQWKI